MTEEMVKEVSEEITKPQETIKDNKRWYIVQAYSGYENRVAVTLREYIKQSANPDLFGDVLVPTEKVIENVGGKRRQTERKFFPGYVLINMEMTEESWHLVKSVPRVMNFVGGTPDKPVPMTRSEAKRILDRMEETAEKAKPRRAFIVGEEVRVTEGPFADFTGVIEEVDFEKGRVKVSVSIFGRATPVELSFGQIEKI